MRCVIDNWFITDSHCLDVATPTAVTTISHVTGTVSANVIQPGVVDGTITSLPAVSPTTAADVLLEVAVTLSI